MTKQADFVKCLGQSLAGIVTSRLCALSLGVVFLAAGTFEVYAQSAPDPARPAKPLSETKSAAPAAKVAAGYSVHQAFEAGGHITGVSGSQPMWDTLINQGSGARILSQSLELRTVDPAKTPFFDTLTTESFGYGGDPNNETYLKFSKGRLYDFSGSFRRDRQYFDYNLLDNSLLSPALVPEPDSMHLFNTVRRNTDTTLTLLPLSVIKFRAGFNHNTMEGPSYSSVHEGGDAQLLQWFRNSSDTYTGGADVRIVRRTTLSYDQFFVFYKGDTTDQLAGATFKLPDGAPVSFGFDNLSSTTCNKMPIVSASGVGNPYCSGFLSMSITAPTRTTFPTEQFRFSSNYWDRISMNGRLLYSGGISNVNNFNEVFNGLTTRTYEREEIDTGGLANGRLAHNKRVDVNGDYGIVADLTKRISISDTFDYWAYRIPGENNVVSTVYAGSAANPPNLLTPLSTLTPTTTTTPNFTYLNQTIESNTVLASVSILPELKISAGYRFKARNIADYGPDDLNWHENWALLGAVIQPTRALRLNVNYDHMSSVNADAATTSNTYTRLAPDKIDHFRIRGTLKAAKWLTFSGTANDYEAKNDDPMVNHKEHNRDFSFGSQIVASEQFSLDLNYAHDNVYSVTDICYISSVATGSSTGPCDPSIAGGPGYLLGNALYSAPSNFGSFALAYAPVRRLRANLGYRINRVDGQAEMLNPLMVPGALQSKYQTPFADVQWNLAPQWTWHGNWQYSGYGEDGASGPTLPRNVHGNVVTLSVKYAY